MKPRLFPSSACSLVGIPLLLALLGSTTQAKPIRLRNETIVTESPASVAAQAPAQAQSAPAQSPAAGLFLIQLESALTPAWQTELRSFGVELLKYVPDDAFVAKFNNVPPGKVRALSYVRWVGPYRSDHKIHPRLAAAARAAPLTNQVIAITVLISPHATPTELAEVRSLFSTIAHESRLRQGQSGSWALGGG